MGGDHKCPVCQATFTRPQHVARHMRSHTGDRPYKCQYCGDQFARSDLLSRHVNKCHANEKPPQNAPPGGRRKGSATASRATTSKQACDQCVQSTLPCDGCNPCCASLACQNRLSLSGLVAKCLSRKSRCTYVKFHRQTAPSGPGHHHARPVSSPSLGGGIGACLPSQLEDFMLAGPPSSVPSMGSSVGGSDHLFNTFAFHAVPAPYPPTSAAPDMAHLQLTMSSDAEMASKYRAQAESLRRAGIPTMPGTMPLYAGQQIHQSQPQPGHWYGWGESGGFPSLDENKSFDGLGRVHSFNADVPSFAPELYDTAVVGSGYRPRRGSLDFSDSSSATSSHSVPSSATSSSSQQPQPQQTHGTGEGGFSSAFGLMSIDDPNVLAGLSSDGVPFFSNVAMGIAPHSPNATPMPTRLQQQQQQQQSRDRGMSTSALPTPGLTKDADARELKDAWRTYIRTPSSGPGSAALDLSTTAAPLAQSPTGQRRRVRVSSLPSVTPTGERGHPLVANGHGGNGHAHGDASGMRMTLHGNPEDLRSYEAAVNARNAALHLNLVPRRRGTQPSVSPAAGSSSSGSAGVEQNGISRPSSSGSVSSLAHAFG
ncbi:hypothetical protein BU15DRAFT_24558, partial [Melanogaster broomeanus]